METLFKIEMMATDMDIILNIANENWKRNADTTSIITNINSLINALVKLKENIENISLQDFQRNITRSIDELIMYFKDIICCCEIKKLDLIDAIFVKHLIPKFKLFRRDIDKFIFEITGVKKIAIDVNCLSKNIVELIDWEKCRAVAFITDNNQFQGKYINDIPVFGKDEIQYLNYDYILVYDYSLCTPEEKGVINIGDYIKYYYNYEVFRAYANYSNCQKPLDGIITGLSYAAVSIDTAQLPYNLVNVAISSQDLFYDYEWAKMILSNHDISDDIKFAIIGLGYYSFEYDLSKSITKDRIYYYYPFFKTSRSHPSTQEIISNYMKFEQVASEVFKKNYNMLLHDSLKEENESVWDDWTSRVMDENNVEKDKWILESDCDKNYPKTVLENIRILDEYILLLKSKKITPIIVICPTHKYYYANFSIRIKEEFNNIINKIKGEFDIQVLDYFDSDAFSNEDFYNISHLNKNGAMKFTKILNESLENMKNDNLFSH